MKRRKRERRARLVHAELVGRLVRELKRSHVVPEAIELATVAPRVILVKQTREEKSDSASFFV
jgi:hypothetical protein